jgi:hypothetical protein
MQARSQKVQSPQHMQGINTIGGNYVSLSLEGISDATSDIVVTKDLSSMGTLRAKGITAKTCTIAGDLNATSISAKELNLTAQAHCGEIKVTLLTLEGTLKAKSLQAESVKGEGTLQVVEITATDHVQLRGRITVEQLYAKQFTLRGEVVANTIDAVEANILLEQKTSSRIENLKSTKLKIEQSKDSGRINIGTLEAQTMHLEGAHVRSIIGTDIVVGKGCAIDKLSYSGTLKVHPSATVNTTTKL